MIRARAAALLAVLLLAACGGGEEGTATLWVTRDRGATLLLEREVAAGQTAMRALGREAKVETRYGGRFVQSVNGVAGSLTAQRDWFWFVNGYEGDTSAAEYRLHDGDVLWWDYRSWRTRMRQPVVVGAFPEPFRHGWAGRVREAVVRYEPGLERRARRLASEVGATSVEPLGTPVSADANLLEVRRRPERAVASLRGAVAPGAPVRIVIAGEPDLVRRYGVP